ncbi:MAG: 8-amino-7-oxononanoate synthase, partial [Gammaproteobacteria bacterium]
MSADYLAWVRAELADLSRAQRRRTLETRAGAQGVEVIVGGRRLKNFSSNNYLGLAADPRVI